MMSKKERAKPGARQEALMAFLRKEMVGDTLLFTAETAARAAESIGATDVTIVYGILKSLEKGGKITRAKKRRGQGMEIAFVKAADARPRGRNEDRGEATISDVLAGIDKEIGEHREEITRLQKDIDKQVAEITRKQDLRAEIARLGGKH